MSTFLVISGAIIFTCQEKVDFFVRILVFQGNISQFLGKKLIFGWLLIASRATFSYLLKKKSIFCQNFDFFGNFGFQVFYFFGKKMI